MLDNLSESLSILEPNNGLLFSLTIGIYISLEFIPCSDNIFIYIDLWQIFSTLQNRINFLFYNWCINYRSIAFLKWAITMVIAKIFYLKTVFSIRIVEWNCYSFNLLIEHRAVGCLWHVTARIFNKKNKFIKTISKYGYIWLIILEATYKEWIKISIKDVRVKKYDEKYWFATSQIILVAIRLFLDIFWPTTSKNRQVSSRRTVLFLSGEWKIR